MDAGNYKIVIKKEGYKEEELQIQANIDKETLQNLNLVPISDLIENEGMPNSQAATKKVEIQKVLEAEPSPSPPIKEGDLLDLGQVDEPPKVLRTVQPVYPKKAQQMGLWGSMTVNALIDEKGNVIETQIVKGIKGDGDGILSKAAHNAVRKWKILPARKSGLAVKVWAVFIISFRAEKQ
jgi:TonB family protein